MQSVIKVIDLSSGVRRVIVGPFYEHIDVDYTLDLNSLSINLKLAFNTLKDFYPSYSVYSQHTKTEVSEDGMVLTTTEVGGSRVLLRIEDHKV